MPNIDIRPNLNERPWADLEIGDLTSGTITRVGLLPDGMEFGEPSFALVATLDDGSTVILQTSWRLMLSALHVLDVSPIAPKLQDIP